MSEQTWLQVQRERACKHVWLRVTGLSAEGWEQEEKGWLYEVCRNDCGAIRQRIGGEELMWPESVIAALEARLAELERENTTLRQLMVGHEAFKDAAARLALVEADAEALAVSARALRGVHAGASSHHPVHALRLVDAALANHEALVSTRAG